MSKIKDLWIEGKGFPDTLVIDGHIHIGEWLHNTTFENVEQAITDSLRFMDSNGIDAICPLSGGYMFGKMDYHLGNEFLLKVWKGLGDRMIPFLHINPNDRKENILEELGKMHRAGVRGIKLINSYQGYPGDGPNLMALYEFASQNKMLIINHEWKEAEIRKIAALYPSVDFIFAHYGGGYQDAVMKEFSNVHANIWSYGRLGWLEKGIKEVGAEKFMMGSDGFLNCLSVGIGPVVFANISDDEKRLILGFNIARLLDKVGALPESLKNRYLFDS